MKLVLLFILGCFAVCHGSPHDAGDTREGRSPLARLLRADPSPLEFPPSLSASSPTPSPTAPPPPLAEDGEEEATSSPPSSSLVPDMSIASSVPYSTSTSIPAPSDETTQQLMIVDTGTTVLHNVGAESELVVMLEDPQLGARQVVENIADKLTGPIHASRVRIFVNGGEVPNSPDTIFSYGRKLQDLAAALVLVHELTLQLITKIADIGSDAVVFPLSGKCPSLAKSNYGRTDCDTADWEGVRFQFSESDGLKKLLVSYVQHENGYSLALGSRPHTNQIVDDIAVAMGAGPLGGLLLGTASNSNEPVLDVVKSFHHLWDRVSSPGISRPPPTDLFGRYRLVMMNPWVNMMDGIMAGHVVTKPGIVRVKLGGEEGEQQGVHVAVAGEIEQAPFPTNLLEQPPRLPAQAGDSSTEARQKVETEEAEKYFFLINRMQGGENKHDLKEDQLIPEVAYHRDAHASPPTETELSTPYMTLPAGRHSAMPRNVDLRIPDAGHMEMLVRLPDEHKEEPLSVVSIGEPTGENMTEGAVLEEETEGGGGVEIAPVEMVKEDSPQGGEGEEKGEEATGKGDSAKLHQATEGTGQKEQKILFIKGRLFALRYKL